MAEEKLRFNLPEEAGQVNWEEMTKMGVAMAPGYLGLLLSEAERFYVTEVGEYLNLRQTWDLVWLKNWVDYYQQFDDGEKWQKAERFVGWQKLPERVKSWQEQGYTVGILTLSNGGGTEGHKHALRWMKNHVDKVVWGFERESFSSRHKGELPFLPLEMRLSMWHWWREAGGVQIDALSVLPEAPTDESELNWHYRGLMTDVGVDYCFGTEGDPNFLDKIARGRRQSRFTIIPALDGLSTGEMSRKLFDGVDGDDDCQYLPAAALEY